MEKKIIIMSDSEKAKQNNEIKYLEKAHDLIFEQLSYADNKLNFILVSAVVLLTASIGGLITLLVENPCGLSWWEWILFGFLIWMTVFFALSTLSCLHGIKPNINKLERSEGVNLFFYDDIAKITDAEKYQELITTGDLSSDLANENILVSKIVSAKHKTEKIGSEFLITGLFFPSLIKLTPLLKDEFDEWRKNNKNGNNIDHP